MAYKICESWWESDSRGRSSSGDNIPEGWHRGVILNQHEKTSNKTHGSDSSRTIYVAFDNAADAAASKEWDFQTLVNNVDIGDYYHNVRRQYLSVTLGYEVTGYEAADYVRGVEVFNYDYAAAKAAADEIEARRAATEAEVMAKLNAAGIKYVDGYIDRESGLISARFHRDKMMTAEEYIQLRYREKHRRAEAEAKTQAWLDTDFNQRLPEGIRLVAVGNRHDDAAIEVETADGIFVWQNVRHYGDNHTPAYAEAVMRKIATDFANGYSYRLDAISKEDAKPFMVSMLKKLKHAKNVLASQTAGRKESRDEYQMRKDLSHDMSLIWEYING